MRDVNRIDEFSNEFAEIWKTNFPDWRFGQLIENFARWYGKDIFYLEEDDFMHNFKRFVGTFKEVK